MAGKNCHLCKRDISKPALVRCRDDRCPLKADTARAPKRVVLAIGGAGALALGAVALIGWQFGGTGHSAPYSPGAPGGSAQAGVALAAAGSVPASFAAGGGKQDKWLAGLFASPATGPDLPAAPVDQRALNARAPSRVQNFSCAGALSASRAAICSNWSLAISDYNLTLLYRNMLARSANAEALRRAHSLWLAKLDTLAGDAAAIQAHYDEWRTRLDEDMARR